MKKIQLMLWAAVCTGMLSGCSAAILAGINNIGTSEANLKTATAKYFNVSEGSVRISNIQNGIFGATYKARVRGVTYNCGANTGNVNCSRPGG